MEHLQGMPLSGRGADIASAGGKRHGQPILPMRSKIEALNGLPKAGRDADISLAGGRRHLLGASERSGSAPAEDRMQSVTVQDLHLLGGRVACGRGLRSRRMDEAPAQRPGVARARSAECLLADCPASPRRARGAAAQPPGSPVKAASRRRFCGTPQQKSEAAEVFVDGQPRKGRYPVLGAGCGPDDTASSIGSLATTASLASLTNDLSQVMSLCSSVKSVSSNMSTPNLTRSPDKALSSAMDTWVKNKMDVAWAALCHKYDISSEPQGAKAGVGSPRKAGARKAGRAAAHAPGCASPRAPQRAPACGERAAKAEAGRAFGGPEHELSQETQRAPRLQDSPRSDKLRPESPTAVTRFSSSCSFVLREAKEPECALPLPKACAADPDGTPSADATTRTGMLSNCSSPVRSPAAKLIHSPYEQRSPQRSTVSSFEARTPQRLTVGPFEVRSPPQKSSPIVYRCGPPHAAWVP